MTNTVNPRRTNDNRTWVWLTRIGVGCALLMIGFPVPQGYDIAQHVRFASAYQQAILDGTLVAHWPYFENFGFGGVGIRFYPPLADYALAFTQFATQDWYDTFLINSFFWMFPGCIGVFFWVKEFSTTKVAALAAVLYAAMPYHLLQIYRMQLYSEFVASAILPFCFLFATKLVKRGSVFDVLSLAVSCSLLVLTHLPASMIGFIALAVYVAIIVDWQRPQRTIARLAAAAAITLASTSFFLIRIFSELEWVKHSTEEFSTGFFDHRRHFFPIIRSFGDQYWDYAPLWRLDLTVTLTFLFLVPLIIWVVRTRSFHTVDEFERKVFVAVSATGLFSIFMLSVASGFIWNGLTILQKTQFPWRFLSVGSLMAAASAACMVSKFSDRNWHFSRLLAYSTIALILGTILFDVTKIILASERPPRDDFYRMSVDTRDSEGCTCWWPTWAEREVFQNRDRVTAGSRRVDITLWGADAREFTVEEGARLDLRVATFYYPYWKATVNNKAVVVNKDEFGAIMIPMSGEISSVRLFFEEPYTYRIAGYFSSVTWIVLLFVMGSYLGRILFIKRHT